MFNDHFEVYLADTEESKNIHYSIRYQVYCEELGYENIDDNPLKMESDEYDVNSVHFIVRNRITNQWVGAMRLIYKKDGRQLPIEKSCVFEQKVENNDLFDMVEISRLCLIKEARRGNPPQGEVEELNLAKDTDVVKALPTQNKLNRLIIWGLFHAASEFLYNNDTNFCYFMTTSILAKVMRRGGLCLTGIGEPCEHRGQRFPFKINAFKTFNGDVWGNDFRSYQLFSEVKVASVA